ncbi:hypothetical protein RF55_6778 [Lasius niger]|uniref:DUF5641 domain-containing protein n=1 Tax=Lasius niger TaxID=67767 RepID=A0A0J7KSD3_LASNI|nr:hypothetical protein RF55_6778 [Lasius niger]
MWWKSDAAPRVGDLCVICGEHTPPGRWPLAHVTAIHPGDDGEVRVVTARTATTTLKGPVAKLVLLSRDTDD